MGRGIAGVDEQAFAQILGDVTLILADDGGAGFLVGKDQLLLRRRKQGDRP